MIHHLEGGWLDDFYNRVRMHTAIGFPVVGYGAVGVSANLSTAALLTNNTEETLQMLAGLLLAA